MLNCVGFPTTEMGTWGEYCMQQSSWQQCGGLCLGRVGSAGQFGVTVGSSDGHQLRRSEESQTGASQIFYPNISANATNAKIPHHMKISCIQIVELQIFGREITSQLK